MAEAIELNFFIFSHNMEAINRDEINLIEILKLIWGRRGVIARFVFVFLMLGLFIAIITPKQFTSFTTFIPQAAEGTSNSRNLGGLAALAGINLGMNSNSSEIPPSLYPKIVSSIEFRSALINSLIKPSGFEKEITYADYYEEHVQPDLLSRIKKYTVGLPALLIRSVSQAVKGESELLSPLDSTISIRQLSEKEVAHFERLDTQLGVIVDKLEGFVRLEFVMTDPVLSAQMTKNAEVLLQHEVMRYKSQSTQEQLNYIQKRFEIKREEFENAQMNLANFRDSNQNVTSALALNRLQKLEAEYSLALEVYTELAKQLEQIKFQLNKDTPIFTIIQPVVVPSERTAPNRILILLIYSFIGLFLSVSWILGNQLFDHFKVLWNQKTP
ncbi:Wzz/FepE/Etk N-terminal domain-containing protein [uncultured Roseivirga sp.]|uniref:Wzz/FepE/Etk N-terminal domain-containing protein n=1 Tax=uncultured Roseivirga sp. TaxID=543088 RepID=UPI0030DB0FB6